MHRYLAPEAPAPTRASVARGDAERALLDSEDGGGAELRGSVPPDPEAVVVILHGGAERGREAVAWWRLPVLRMLPFARAVERRAGDRLAVLRLKNRVRGWNGAATDPVVDARWALDRVRRVLPGVPIALVGHSMGAASHSTSPPTRTSPPSSPSPRGSRTTSASHARAPRCCSCTAPATGSRTRAAPRSSPAGSPRQMSRCVTSG